jgi:tetratricopeptide (TPR) repeat protein
MLQEERIAKLKEMLAQSPDDLFSLYAMAMELKSLGRFDESLNCLNKVLALAPESVSAYYQKAQILVKQSQIQAARETLEAGMPRAVEAGQFHARDRMRELLDILNGSKK